MAFTKVVLTGTKDKIKTAFTRFNTMIDDLLAITSGKGASQVGILDAAGNMDAANIEDALAEIYTDTLSVRTLGEVFAVNTATTTGLTWGYTAGSVRFDNTVTAVAAGTVSLTDNATNYVEVASDGTVSRNTTGFTSGRIPIRQIVTLAGVQTTSTDKRSWFQSWDMPIPVAKGGTGAATLTDGGILLGSGTGAITALGVATNGQIPIGDGTTDPVLAAPTGTANQVTVTLGAGTIGLSLPTALIPPGTVDPVGVLTLINTGLHILDTNASHDLIIKPGSDLTADKTLTITTGDADRTISISGNLSIAGNLTTAGVVSISAYGATLVDDADAATALSTLGVSTFAKTILDDADAATVRSTIAACASDDSRLLSRSQLFTSSGTWTRPSGVTTVNVVCLGGGGGGGGGGYSGTVGGGGGGRGCAAEYICTVSGDVTVTVGTGGAGGLNDHTGSITETNGTNGSDSSFGTLAVGGGGIGGKAYSSGYAGGDSGAASGSGTLVNYVRLYGSPGTASGGGDGGGNYAAYGTIYGTRGYGGIGGAIATAGNAPSGVAGFVLVTW